MLIDLKLIHLRALNVKVQSIKGNTLLINFKRENIMSMKHTTHPVNETISDNSSDNWTKISIDGEESLVSSYYAQRPY